MSGPDELLAMSAADLRAELARQVDLAGGQKRWAEAKGIAVSQVCETLSGRREPTEGIINAMGFMRVTRYLRLRRGHNG